MEVAETFVKYTEPYLQLQGWRVYVNSKCNELESWQIIGYSVGATLLGVWTWQLLNRPEDSLWHRIKKSVFRTVKKLPYVRNKVAEEMKKSEESMMTQFHKEVQHKHMEYIQILPSDGLTEAQLLEEIQKYKSLDLVKWKDGACSGTVYNGDDALTQIMAKIYGEFAWTNPLHADVFPDVRKMEAEIVRMTCNMFNGTSECCGTVTSGGTESIMLACKVYRDIAYEKGIRYPNMVIPETAHAAFDKAGQYFRIRVIHVAVDKETRKCDMSAMKWKINKNTCMLAGSAPQFGHGVIDPIEEIAALGKRYGIPVHVDACLGGFLIPFMKKAGYPLEPFDFNVDGVTSISADTHKFGFAPKGSSVIMYSNKNYRSYQYFVQPDWPGGIYASPTFAGSRAGAIIAACWATMMYFGENGYVDSTKRIIETQRNLLKELRKMNHIFVYGEPNVSVVGFGSKEFNIFRLSDAMTEKGWNLNALQFPSSIHLCVTLVHTKPGVAERFLSDMKECIGEIMKNPKAECGGAGALYGMAQSIPDRSLVSDIAGLFFDAYYSTKLAVKDKSANGTM